MMIGRVIASFGRHVTVEASDGKLVLCRPRAKKNQCVVGDWVEWTATEDEGTIEKVVQRKNLFYRQDEIRTKSFAANVDQLLVWIAAEPEFSENQLARALIAAKAQGIEAIIVLNKLDLGANFDRAWTRLLPYQAMGYTVLAISASPKADLSPEQQIISNQSRLQLEAALKGKSTLVLGPSGTGKSTIINQWVPTAGAHTQEISKALNSGKHTTTSTTLYWIDAEKTTAVLDSPGFQEFGLHHISAQDLDKLMPDFVVHVGNCRFYNCTHRHEPQCAVTQFRQAGTPASTISEERYRIYNSLYEELSRSPH